MKSNPHTKSLKYIHQYYKNTLNCRKIISLSQKKKLTSTHSVTLDLAMCLIATYSETYIKFVDSSKTSKVQ